MSKYHFTKDDVKKSRLFSPGIFEEKIVYFLHAGNDFFYVKEAAEAPYLKDGKGKYIQYKLDAVIKARLQYLAVYFEQELESSINNEIDNLKNEVKEKAEKIINIITQYERWAQGNQTVIESIFASMAEQDERILIEKGKSFLKLYPDAADIKLKLQDAVLKADYSVLHKLVHFYFIQPAATFKIGQDDNITALKNIFGAANINDTLDEMNEKGPLYLEAKVKVEKMYFPQ